MRVKATAAARRRLKLLAAASLLAFCAAASARAQEHVGVVYDLSGDWVVTAQGRQSPLRHGQGLRAGSVVRPASPEARIVIHLVDDRVVTCTSGNLGPCESPLPGRRRTSLRGRFWNAVSYLLMGQVVPPPAETSARAGDGRGDLRESVVELKDGRADLAPVFGGMKRGEYVLRFEPVGRGRPRGGARPLDGIVYKWEPEATGPVTVAGLRPGVYRVVRTDEGEPAGEAWVLFAGPARYKEAAREFQEGVAWSRTWSREPDDAVLTFQRAYLTALGGPGGR